MTTKKYKVLSRLKYDGDQFEIGDSVDLPEDIGSDLQSRKIVGAGGKAVAKPKGDDTQKPDTDKKPPADTGKQEPDPGEIDALRARAKELGVKYQDNWGVAGLTKGIAKAEAAASESGDKK